MNEPYGLIIQAQARRALEHTLAPPVAFAAWEFIAGLLRENPHRVGKPRRHRSRGTGRHGAGTTASGTGSTTRNT